jgi:hypothetical protein
MRKCKRTGRIISVTSLVARNSYGVSKPWLAPLRSSEKYCFPYLQNSQRLFGKNQARVMEIPRSLLFGMMVPMNPVNIYNIFTTWGSHHAKGMWAPPLKIHRSASVATKNNSMNIICQATETIEPIYQIWFLA